MISVIYKKRTMRVNAVWFCEEMSDFQTSKKKADIVFFHGVKNPLQSKNAIVNEQYTLVLDLTQTLDLLFKNINRNTKYKINRAKREGVECSVFEANSLKASPFLLNSFKQEYEAFTKLKGIPSTYNTSAMEKYTQGGSVVLTRVSRGDEVYAQHVYVCDEVNARLLYSVSNFRNEGVDRSFIGRANKYLHWHDIEYFKNSGHEIFDWGGISSFDNPNGVDQFKMEFGGQQERHFNVMVGESQIGKMALAAMKILGE